jgi:hypothetical protein
MLFRVISWISYSVRRLRRIGIEQTDAEKESLTIPKGFAQIPKELLKFT